MATDGCDDMTGHFHVERAVVGGLHIRRGQHRSARWSGVQESLDVDTGERPIVQSLRKLSLSTQSMVLDPTFFRRRRECSLGEVLIFVGMFDM